MYYIILGKDAKRGILLDEECQVDIESAFYRETVAKKYASLFHSTLHHNTGYFLQVCMYSAALVCVLRWNWFFALCKKVLKIPIKILLFPWNSCLPGIRAESCTRTLDINKKKMKNWLKYFWHSLFFLQNDYW